jgi:hypothetical protein
MRNVSDNRKIGILRENSLPLQKFRPIPVAAPSKTCICGRWLAGTTAFNRTAGMDVCCESSVLWGGGLCVGLIAPPEESYCGCVCVCVCVCEWVWSHSSIMRSPWRTRNCNSMERKKNATFSTMNLTQSDLEVNLCIQRERPIKQLLVFSISESIYILVASDKN